MLQRLTGSLVLSLLLLFGNVAYAAPQFPALTDRVVDNAQVISPNQQRLLTDILSNLEQRTGDQLVVLTLPTLDGMPIEDYAVQLGRHWHIGQKGKNNGVTIIVAVQDKQVRIDVGYGLEGDLTDAVSRKIIEENMIPRFREGKIGKGIVDGVIAVVNILSPEGAGTNPESTKQQLSETQLLLIFLLIFSYIILWFRHPDLAWFILNMALSFGGGRSSGNRDDGFSGGRGGSFGGGGASGRW